MVKAMAEGEEQVKKGVQKQLLGVFLSDSAHYSACGELPVIIITSLSALLRFAPLADMTFLLQWYRSSNLGVTWSPHHT